MRAAIYTLALNDNMDLSDWLRATAHADDRVVFDIGSTDGTADQLEKAGCTVYRGQNRAMRADDALNAVLGLLPSGIDACFRVDFNERPRPGWRPVLEAAWSPDTAALQVLINASLVDPNSQQTHRHRYGELRLHRRLGFRWSGACGETLIRRGEPAFQAEQSPIIVDRLMPRQQPDIAALKEAVDESLSPQRSFRYAEALLRGGNLQDGLAEISRHVGQGGSARADRLSVAAGRADRRCQRARLSAQCPDRLLLRVQLSRLRRTSFSQPGMGQRL